MKVFGSAGYVLLGLLVATTVSACSDNKIATNPVAGSATSSSASSVGASTSQGMSALAHKTSCRHVVSFVDTLQSGWRYRPDVYDPAVAPPSQYAETQAKHKQSAQHVANQTAPELLEPLLGLAHDPFDKSQLKVIRTWCGSDFDGALQHDTELNKQVWATYNNYTPVWE